MIPHFSAASEIMDQAKRIEAFCRPVFPDISLAALGINALAEISSAVKILKPFDEKMVDQLRANLGDWQVVPAFEPNLLLNREVRSDFYFSRGLNPNIRNVSSVDFYNATADGGIRVAPFQYTEVGENRSSVPDIELLRTNAAHKGFFSFERKLRTFFMEKMSQAFGADWQKHRLPTEMLKKWLEKRRKDGNDNVDPIEFADFTDYLQIIQLGNNWKELFKDIFGRESSVFESFVRLYPVRNCVSHSRFITQEDELLMIVEIDRLSKAIIS
ncbi:MAG: Swt1 family HEPN domain-containing protein [Aestuariivirga sp.]